jgi:hypothetical protein
MKKNTYFKTVLGALCLSVGMGLTGCGDNDDFSTQHVLTAEEIAELARQDSILEAQRSKINADLILEYTADMTISSQSYDGFKLTIEWDKIADAFGLTKNQVFAGICEEDGAPEIIGFAIQGSTHADVSGASNTNGYWGHWWDANGDVTTWGSDAAVYCEYYGKEEEDDEDYLETISVGQYPGHLEDGQTVKIIECLKYNEVRVAVVININCHALGEVKATVVGTQEYTQTQAPTYNYESYPLTFDLDKVLADLGISSLAEASFISVNPDGSYAQECTANNGYWYDMDGFAGSWGDDASFFIEYYGLEDDAEEEDINSLYIGQYPGHLSGGESITMKYGIMANNKIEMLTITVNIEAYEDPETAPEGAVETDREIDVTITKAWDDTYSNVQYDVKDVLRNAFKMTTYQIFSAKNDGSLAIYCGEIKDEEPTYTSDTPGYWLNAAGEACSWGTESLVFCCLGGSETELYLYAGNHPTSCVAGTTVKSTYYITCNGGIVKVNLTVVVE